MSVSKLQEEFIELQKEIGKFQELLNLAMDESEVSLEVLQHSIKSNIWELKVRLDDIALAIAQEKKNAEKKYEVHQVAKSIFKMVSEMEEEISKAQVIESSKNSTLQELTEAYEILKEVEEEGLPKLEAEYSKLPTVASEDSLRNNAFEEQIRLVENLKNIQSSILDRIETINEFNCLVSSFKDEFSSISRKLEVSQFNFGKINDIKTMDLKKLLNVLENIKELANERDMNESVLLQECEEKLTAIKEAIDLKLTEAEWDIVNTVTKKLNNPTKDVDFELLEKDIAVLPQESISYIDLKNKINSARAKFNLQEKTKNELEVIIKTLKEINAAPKKSLSVNEHIIAFKQKLNDLTEYLKPKTDSFTLTGDAEIDKNIRKQKQQVEEAIKNVRKQLELKESEKANTDMVMSVIDHIDELVLKSENKQNKNNLIDSKETFSLLKDKILGKSQELHDLMKKPLSANLKEIVERKIKIIEKALRNTNLILCDIERCEQEVSESEGKLSEIDVSGCKAILSAKELIERYSKSPQPFDVASNDIELISSLIVDINEYMKAISQIAETFKNYNYNTSLLVEKMEEYINTNKNLEELKTKVEKDIDRERNLIEMKKRLQETLNQIAEKASILINKVDILDL
uniref:GAR domain-containing protein n=1 Tax=Strongyloides venezuelensis TaxID=75913 RepID=A0A0K0F8A4_STRVS